MHNTNMQAPFALSLWGRILIMAGAGLLILVGLVLQLGALGYGHAQPDNIWIASTIVGSAWSMLVTQLDSAMLRELATFWPLVLISMGLALLLVTKRKEAQPAFSSFQEGQNHGQ